MAWKSTTAAWRFARSTMTGIPACMWWTTTTIALAAGEHGDVIDFAAKLFGLPLYEAAQQLAADFHLTPDKPPSAAALHAKCIRTEAQQLMENERLCFAVLSD